MKVKLRTVCYILNFSFQWNKIIYNLIVITKNCIHVHLSQIIMEQYYFYTLYKTHSPYLKEVNTNTFTMCFLKFIQFERNIGRHCHKYIKHATLLMNLIILGFVPNNGKGINVILKQ